MKTKLTKKQIEKEINKVRLFNSLYGFDFQTEEYDEKKNEYTWNGMTLADHVQRDKGGKIRFSALELINTRKIYVYGLVRRVSANGMNRQISLFAVTKSGEIANITYMASLILNGKEPATNSWHEHVIKVTGTGMDMVFHLVYNLSSILFEGIEGLEGLAQEGREGYILNKRNL
tara:strand:- start:1729 stop:2250 length:522 start_codon:yes stop_codon:yes gene_type:complete